MEVILTNSQKEAAEKIDKFLKSDQMYFRLTGPPGSGKTFLIKYALERFLKEEEDTGKMCVVGITLSHKAKNVLNKASIRHCRTFASAYGYKEVIKDDGSRVFSPASFLEEKPVGHLPIPIFVHDEISQYSYEMKKIVFSKTSLFSKVILMGDKAQLPPIDSTMAIDEDSPMFSFELPDFCQHELNERVRQKKGNPILDLSDVIREEIFGSQNMSRVIEEILKPKLDSENKGYLIIDEKDLYDKYLKSKNFLENKIIAFRKFKVNIRNNEIRSLLFPKSNQKIISGDLVFMTNNFVSEDAKQRLMNSDEFVVVDVRTWDMPGPTGKKIECYVGDVYSDGIMKQIITPTEAGEVEYQKTLERLISDAKQNPKLWPHKFAFEKMFCEFTMGYGINAYKCQGSTYKNVFIDLLDILETKPLTTKRKLQTIFTALTRATDVAYFIKP